jgi:hypothetical protein
MLRKEKVAPRATRETRYGKYLSGVVELLHSGLVAAQIGLRSHQYYGRIRSVFFNLRQPLQHRPDQEMQTKQIGEYLAAEIFKGSGIYH